MALHESRRLEQTARKVAFGRLPVKSDVRTAVRDLTLTALRARVLTLPHVASVATAIHQGIDPARAEVKDRAPAAQALALDGLSQALLNALVALDLACRQYVSVGGCLSESEIDEWLRAVDALPAIEGAEFAVRLESIKTTLHAAESDEAIEGTYVLGLLASGALLGLLETGARPGPGVRPRAGV